MSPARIPICSTLPVEIILAIFKETWKNDELASSVCLGLTCKEYLRIHKSRTNKRKIIGREHSYRSLTSFEQAEHETGVVYLFPNLNVLLNPKKPHKLLKYAVWDRSVMLRREGHSNMFCLYTDYKKLSHKDIQQELAFLNAGIFCGNGQVSADALARRNAFRMFYDHACIDTYVEFDPQDRKGDKNMLVPRGGIALDRLIVMRRNIRTVGDWSINKIIKMKYKAVEKLECKAVEDTSESACGR